MLAPEPPPPAALPRELRRRLAEAQAERVPSVSAAAVLNGEVIWADAIGLANVEEGIEATVDTQYRIGSITKTFTAVAVMQLRDDGKLELDDTLSRHIPEAKHGDLTIRRMLTHLSGLQREPAGEIWEASEMPDAEGLVAQLADAERVLPSQVADHYSNLAYALLGEVVARASGTPYRELVDERVIRPLALGRTTWAPAAPFAQGYFVEPYHDVVRAERHVDLRGSTAAGQLWSTAGDLCAWATFLAAGREGVLAPETVGAMWFPHAMWDPDEWTLGRGLGLMLHRRAVGILGGHRGAMPGHLAAVFISRRQRIGAAALANSTAGTSMELLALQLAEATINALGRELEPEPWRPDDPVPPPLATALGRWWMEGDELVFSWRDKRLQVREEGVGHREPPAFFEPLGDDLFRTVSGREQGELLRLIRDEAGTVVRMYWATYPLTRQPEVFGSD